MISQPFSSCLFLNSCEGYLDGLCIVFRRTLSSESFYSLLEPPCPPFIASKLHYPLDQRRLKWIGKKPSNFHLSWLCKRQDPGNHQIGTRAPHQQALRTSIHHSRLPHIPNPQQILATPERPRRIFLPLHPSSKTRLHTPTPKPQCRPPSPKPSGPPPSATCAGPRTKNPRSSTRSSSGRWARCRWW